MATAKSSIRLEKEPPNRVFRDRHSKVAWSKKQEDEAGEIELPAVGVDPPEPEPEAPDEIEDYFN